jgi:hypothetical protein
LFRGGRIRSPFFRSPTVPHRTAAQHQSLLDFVGEGRWSDERVFVKVHEMVVPQLERHGAIEAWIIDDTGFPKQGDGFCAKSMTWRVQPTQNRPLNQKDCWLSHVAMRRNSPARVARSSAAGSSKTLAGVTLGKTLRAKLDQTI